MRGSCTYLSEILQDGRKPLDGGGCCDGCGRRAARSGRR